MRDATMPALLHMLVHHESSDAEQAHRAVSLLRRVTDSERYLLAEAPNLGTWPAVLGALRAHPAAPALHLAGQQLLFRLVGSPVPNDDTADDTPAWVDAAAAALTTFCRGGGPQLHAELRITCAAVLLEAAPALVRKSKYSANRARALLAVECVMQHAPHEGSQLMCVLRASHAVLHLASNSDSSTAAVTAVTKVLTDASPADTEVQLAALDALLFMLSSDEPFFHALLLRSDEPVIAAAAAAVVAVLRHAQERGRLRTRARVPRAAGDLPA